VQGQTTRNAIAAAGVVCALASPALAVETSNFNLATTRDLVALCSCQPDDQLYAEALQFCYGYMAGMAHLHRALVRADDIRPVACPRYEVTREASGIGPAGTLENRVSSSACDIARRLLTSCAMVMLLSSDRWFA
jgi:hypothetical protein